MTGRMGGPEWRVDADAVYYAMRCAGFETVDALAGASGVAYATLHLALTGETARPSADTMMRIAGALGCEVANLMKRSEMR